jgi:chemotaxis protein MotB
VARRTRGGGDGGGGSERWLGTYGDMVTLLMAFFVMLFAMSETDAKKFEAFVAGLAGPFGNTAIREGLLDAGTGLTPGSPSVPEPLLLVPEVAASVQVPGEGGPAQAADEAEAQLEQVQSGLEQALEGAGLAEVAQFRRDERGLVVTIASDSVLFATGSTAIGDRGRQIVGTIAPILAGIPNTVLVEGHTDNAPLDRGGYTNWNLSTDRAVAVLNLLAGAHGVDPRRLGAAGYGEFRPLADNAAPEGRSANRRVEVVVVPLGPPAGAAPPAG